MDKVFGIRTLEDLGEASQLTKIEVPSDKMPHLKAILPAARIVDPALQLECDQPLGAHDMQSPEGCLQLGSCLQQLTGDGSVRVQEVEALVTP